MNRTGFSKLFFIVMLGGLFSLYAGAQTGHHYIYIQNALRTPYNVMIGQQLYQSTPSGYLVIPRLVSGDYNLKVHSLHNDFKDQQFRVLVKDQDLGYVLKYSGDASPDSWMLRNLYYHEDSILSYNGSASSPVATTSASEVAVDSQRVVATVDSSEKIDSAISLKTKADVIVKNDPVKDSAASLVSLQHSETGSFGVKQVYSDSHAGGTDTIDVLIPHDISNTETSRSVAATQASTANADSPSGVPAGNEGDNAASVFSRFTPKSSVDIATMDDFLKIRKAMASAMDDEKMLDIAGFYFKTKSFSVEQIKNLGNLFLTEDQRFIFFKEAKLHVIDLDHFHLLESQFSNTTLKVKFQELLKNN